MVNIADGDVIVAGDVFKIEQQTNRESGEVRHKVTIFSGDGAVVVNVKTEDLAKLRQGLPQRGDYVAWFVRNSPYNVEGNSGMSTRFLRPVLVQDLEAIANGAKLGQQAAAKAA